ncbi:thymidylate kinase [Hathewaya proteolytica DSM 3090]|uniref:Thymidylate kinase n=1 Tax=Hathewaya proteolytica DSM 3090 TaxID=1121331 RepID=A0A1M6T3D6_9CLOT|nr:dTMP kinase [Hathewaya proteolytica]SHK51467.1 thymidylate kinase [Hathewaya proteolytica DSM 3090]
MRTRGLFITLEGGEGAGKTTQITEIEKYLKQRGIECICTREPGGIPISESIRSIILDRKNVNMDGRTEALLYAAARRQHLVEKVIPALESGTTVICDRFIDSSLAYQGSGRGIGMDEVYKINEFAMDGYLPDLTILLDLDMEVGLERIERRRGEMNRLDMEKLDFHSKVRKGFLKLLQDYPDRIKKVDASLQKEEVTKQITDILEKIL